MHTGIHLALISTAHMHQEMLRLMGDCGLWMGRGTGIGGGTSHPTRQGRREALK